MDKIICLGKNYPGHASEIGDKQPEKPVLFLKPPSVLKTAENNQICRATYPPGGITAHYETEIVLRVCKDGYKLRSWECTSFVDAVTVGIDMTLRERQSDLKSQGHPWTTAKVFPDSAIVGPFIDIKDFTNFLDTPFSFALDGKIKQTALGSEMLHSPFNAICYISEFFPLCEGDLIFTGTPSGVGPVAAGQTGTVQWGPIKYSIYWKRYGADS